MLQREEPVVLQSHNTWGPVEKVWALHETAGAFLDLKGNRSRLVGGGSLVGRVSESEQRAQ